MNQFLLFLKMGFEHIADLKGYDHMLFIMVLCAIYSIADWKNVMLLITAFTLGHATTLVLAALKIVVLNTKLIEILIPLTILCTSISNLFYDPQKKRGKIEYNYLLAFFFGLIHGMGFSNFFNALMSDSTSIALPLFSFNLGLEIGQLMIVLAFFACYYLVGKVNKTSHQSWTIFFSGAGAGISIAMLIDRI